VAIENYRTAAEIELLKQRLGEERSYLEGHSRSEGQFPEIVGDSAALRQVLDQVATSAASEATRADSGGNRNGEGTGRPCDTSDEPPQGWTVHQSQLRRDPHRPAGERIVRA
jgi:hypothetical protein